MANMTVTTTHRILVVDDEQDMTQSLRRLLRIEGYEVVVASSGEEAIRRARDFQPDGILMDLQMPGIDGLDAYRSIRVLCPNAFVIFMTAYSVKAEQAEAEGAVAVLSKPLDPAATCEIIAEALVTRPLLIVDDDDEFCDSLARVLSAKGCCVQAASSAEQARALFEKQPRSVVLLGKRLAGTTGLDLLRHLKERNRSAIVIAISGSAEMEVPMRQGLEMKATACFAKPLDIDRLLSAIDDAVRARETQVP